LDGLAYLLDIVDHPNHSEDNCDQSYHRLETNDSNDNQTDGSEYSDHEFDNQQQMEQEFNDSEGSDLEEDKELSESEDEIDSNGNEEPQNRKLKEDIYGFIRDSAGNIVKKSGEKPNILSKVSHINAQLLRQIRGAFNRLTVNNMLTISGQIEDIFKQNSRHEVNEALWSCITSSLIDLDHCAPNKLTTEVSILLSILHSTIGEEVGGHAIHTLIRQFDECLKQTDQLNDSKKIDNLVLIIINLYVCGLIESVLVYDLIIKLCEIFNEKCIELINLILKSVGFILRKDNPIKMKELILKVQNLALSIDKNSLSGNRISFVLESLIAIKNNNKSKVKGYGTVVEVELIENTLKSSLKKVRVNGIAGRYDAVLQSSHWYSYTQNMEALNLDKTQSNDTKFDASINHEMNDRLFKALRLNTPLRKTIFIALSTCNDYIDAAHRLISIAKKQFSEVINVLIHVAIHEKNYNPFYLHLFQHLSKCDRKYKVSFHLNLS
jgi:nucleolar MIF4G domain-containing protein 1